MTTTSLMKIPAFRKLMFSTTIAFAKGLPALSVIALIETSSLVLHTNAQSSPQ